MEFLAELHPLVVHFPIAFLLCYSLIEIIGVLINNDKLSSVAYWALVTGLVTTLVAVLTGNQAAVLSEQSFLSNLLFPHELVERHEDFASLTIWFFLFVSIWRTYLLINKKFKGRIRYIFIIFAVVGAYLIWMTGHIGGDLVYKHGVGTELTKPQN